MKTILTVLTLLGTLFVAAPDAEARPHHRGNVYVAGHTDCGCPIRVKRVFVGYDHCGAPVYRTHRQSVRHRCGHHRDRHHRARHHYDRYDHHARHRGPHSVRDAIRRKIHRKIFGR